MAAECDVAGDGGVGNPAATLMSERTPVDELSGNVNWSWTNRLTWLVGGFGGWRRKWVPCENTV